MKKIYKFMFVMMLAFANTVVSYGQCTPDPQYTQPGIYPDTIQNLPHAQEGVPYSTTITFVIPASDTINGFPISVDKVILKTIVGLPANFSYACNTGNCTWNGGTSGCALISGNPQQGQAGTYPLKAAVEYYVGGLQTPQKDTAYGYKIVIDPAAGVSLIRSEDLSISPNPANDRFILFNAQAKNLEVLIYNTLGELIQAKTTISNAKNIQVNVNDLPDGIYFIKVNNQGKTLKTEKLVVAH
ncbi:MAG: hypothetical protein KatS3mg034_0677 [Vicingaceae bacterium]|nr:MAG: hypothetical protein KatS3mg034_0677 [Vicingaceae bacterium]